MVECDLAKVEVAGSNPVSRSRFLEKAPAGLCVFLRPVGPSLDFLLACG